MSDLIAVKDLRKSYGDFEAVKGISFSVPKGEIFGILGPNGAGKTSTLEMMEGMRDITSGLVIINGIDVAAHPYKVKEMIGIQLQSSSFFANLSLVEILKLFGDLYGQKKDPAELLAEVGLSEKSRSRVKQLSGGQQQRFSIAAALVNDPVALFLDEPTTGLDPQARRNLWELIRGVQKKGKTIILTTHYMEEAEALCGRVAIMDAGKIIALDSPDKLVDQLLAGGFKKQAKVVPATLEDVFIELTGHDLREE